MAVTVGRHGAELFGPMARFVGGVWAAHGVMVLCYLLLLRMLTAWSPVEFLRRTGTVWATTVATTSSLASLSASPRNARAPGSHHNSHELASLG